MYTFHQNQIDTSNEIIGLITLAQCFCMIMLAQMQSGKTGTYLRTAIRTIELGLHNQVIILCGSRDTSLRAQTTQDLEDAIESYCNTDKIEDDLNKAYAIPEEFRKIVEVILTIQNKEIKLQVAKELKEKLKSNIKVIWSQDLKNVVSVEDNTFIIHDESHAAQDKDHRPYKDFYEKHNIEGLLLGDTSQVIGRNIHTLDVSATPFSALASNQKVRMNSFTPDELVHKGDTQLSVKKEIFANAGSGYKGVINFLDKSLFFEAESIKEGSTEHIEKVLRKKKYANKYCIIRTHKADEFMKSIADKCGYDYVPIFADASDDAFDILKTAPSRATIINICQKCRMGQVLCKTHIGMVYEQADNPNTDTILQGLLGRMCGYNVSELPDIYLSKKTEVNIRKYAKSCRDEDSEQFNEIKKINNVKGSNKHTNGDLVMDMCNEPWIKTVPIEFTMHDVNHASASDRLVNWGNIEENDLVNLFEKMSELITNNPDKTEVVKILKSAKKVHKRNIFEHTYKNRDVLGKMEKASSENMRFVDQFSNSITGYTTDEVRPFQIIGSDKNGYNSNGKVFVIGFVKYNPNIHGQMSTTLPKVNPKCNHALSTIVQEDDSVVDNFNGGQTINFPFETSEDIGEFEKELEKSILRTIPGPKFTENCSRSINSMYCNESKLYKGIYSKAKMPELRNIEKKLNKKYPSINLKFNKKIRSDKPGYTRFPSITW